MSSSVNSSWLAELYSSASSVTCANSAPKGFESLALCCGAKEGCTDKGVGIAGALEAIWGAAKAVGSMATAGDRGDLKGRLEDVELAEDRVDREGVREMAWRFREAVDTSMSREERETDRDRATASIEFFLVWVGERWGIMGAGTGAGSGSAGPGLAEFLK